MPRLPDNLRQRAIGQIQAGSSFSDVARNLQVHKSTISRLWARFQATNSTADAQRSGRPNVMTPRQRRAIVRHHRQNPFDTAQTTARLTIGTNNRPVSRQTVARVLAADGLETFRPYRGVILTQRHRQARLNWGQAHQNWRLRQWRQVMFSDEVQFCIDSVSGYIRIWRRRGTRMARQNILRQPPRGGPSVMMWGGMVGGQLYGPVFFQNRQPGAGGGVNAQRYLNQVIRPAVLPVFARRRGLTFQHDNAPVHTARVVRQVLAQNNIPVMPWPAYSPDMNPIENLWASMKNRLNRMVIRPRNQHALQLAIQQVWNGLPRHLPQRLVDSMPRRCAAVVAAQGDHTRY